MVGNLNEILHLNWSIAYRDKELAFERWDEVNTFYKELLESREKLMSTMDLDASREILYEIHQSIVGIREHWESAQEAVDALSDALSDALFPDNKREDISDGES